MSKTHLPGADTATEPATADRAIAPGKVAATSRLQLKRTPGAPPPPQPGTESDVGGQSHPDDPFGMHLEGEAGGEQGPPAQNASDRIQVRVNGGEVETWMVVKIVDATSFVAKDPAGALHKFMKGAVSREESPYRGEGQARTAHRVYDVVMRPESAAQRIKGAIGRTWHHVQHGFQWVEEQQTGKSRAELDQEESARDAERNSKVTIGVRG